MSSVIRSTVSEIRFATDGDVTIGRERHASMPSRTRQDA